MKGVYDWDQGVPRAQELCKEYELQLHIVQEENVKEILGFPTQEDLISRFESIFSGDDFEFLGTLLIRLVLTSKAKEFSAKYIATGLNLEDVLCECLYRVSSQLAPLPFPIRKLPEVTLIYPLWECPKKIIDSCFPKFSLDNYQTRYPSFSLGRNLYYLVSYSIQSQFPGITERFLYGLQSLAKPVNYSFDEELQLFIERKVPLNIKNKFMKLFGK